LGCDLLNHSAANFLPNSVFFLKNVAASFYKERFVKKASSKKMSSPSLKRSDRTNSPLFGESSEGPRREKKPKPNKATEKKDQVAAAAKLVSASPGKAPVRAPTPNAPPPAPLKKTLLSKTEAIAKDEEYGKDEVALNGFLKLHPMLSLEATSQRTLQLITKMSLKSSVVSADLPVVPKTYDDKFLCPAVESIGERPCINGDRCLAKFVAQVRYGEDTKYAFTCKEFLLPSQHADFLSGKGLPLRRAKCLLCTRYYQNYIYILARTDPSFRASEAVIGTQVFCNAFVPQKAMPKSSKQQEEAADLQEAATKVPTHASSISTADGYLPSAMLYVDEDFLAHRCAREDQVGVLAWRPTVRFCSSHYKYVNDVDGLRIIQVGVGVNDHHFLRPSEVAVPEAEKRPCKNNTCATRS
jgi:hypothetical protein